MEIVELRDTGALLPTTCVCCVYDTSGVSVRNGVARRAHSARVGHRVEYVDAFKLYREVKMNLKQACHF